MAFARRQLGIFAACGSRVMRRSSLASQFTILTPRSRLPPLPERIGKKAAAAYDHDALLMDDDIALQSQCQSTGPGASRLLSKFVCRSCVRSPSRVQHLPPKCVSANLEVPAAQRPGKRKDGDEIETACHRVGRITAASAQLAGASMSCAAGSITMPGESRMPRRSAGAAPDRAGVQHPGGPRQIPAAFDIAL